jgi:hypothetical protein
VLDRASSFLNIRVKDTEAVYAEWSARGAQFLTPSKQRQDEIRCYIWDPGGYLIEVGQTADPVGDWSFWLPSHRIHEHATRRCVAVCAPSDPAALGQKSAVADRLFHQEMGSLQTGEIRRRGGGQSNRH